jgi:hypothetical protein
MSAHAPHSRSLVSLSEEDCSLVKRLIAQSGPIAVTERLHAELEKIRAMEVP